jgi:hypothetical protein
MLASSCATRTGKAREYVPGLFETTHPNGRVSNWFSHIR